MADTHMKQNKTTQQVHRHIRNISIEIGSYDICYDIYSCNKNLGIQAVPFSSLTLFTIPLVEVKSLK